MPLTKQQKHFIFVLCFVRAALDFLEGTESAETRQTRYKRKRLDLKINVDEYSGLVKLKTDEQFCDSFSRY